MFQVRSTRHRLSRCSKQEPPHTNLVEHDNEGDKEPVQGDFDDDEVPQMGPPINKEEIHVVIAAGDKVNSLASYL